MNQNATLATVTSARRHDDRLRADRQRAGRRPRLRRLDRPRLATPDWRPTCLATNTVFNFDRRGRGDSGDTLPYAVEREIEDIAAVIEATGGPAGLYGTSSGGALALHAAAALGSTVRKLAIWEAPYFVDPAPRARRSTPSSSTASGSTPAIRRRRPSTSWRRSSGCRQSSSSSRRPSRSSRAR